MLRFHPQGRQLKLVVQIFFLLRLNLYSLEQFCTVYFKFPYLGDIFLKNLNLFKNKLHIFKEICMHLLFFPQALLN